MRKFLVALAVAAATLATEASAETLKVAVAQRGFWNSTFIDIGLKQGFFKEAGLDIEILYTEGGASTLTPVIAGSHRHRHDQWHAGRRSPLMPRACR